MATRVKTLAVCFFCKQVLSEGFNLEELEKGKTYSGPCDMCKVKSVLGRYYVKKKEGKKDIENRADCE